MAIWADSYKAAKLNGVPFLVTQEATQFGRRNDVAITPGSDLAQHVDLGRSIRPMNFTAFFLGADYDSQRNAFIKVLSGPGPYRLIHPHYGPTFVIVNDRAARILHTDSDGLRAGLTIGFLEVNEKDFAKNLDTRIAVTTFATDLTFALEFAPPTLPSNDFSLLGKLQDLGLLMTVIQGKIAARLNVIESITSAVQAFNDGLDGLLGTPGVMMAQVNGLMTAVFDLHKTARDTLPDKQVRSALEQVAVLMESITEVATFAEDELFVPPVALSAVIDHKNRRGLSAGIRLSGLAAGCTQLVETELDSADEALDLQTRLVKLFDGAREEGLSREVTKASRGLRGAIGDHLRNLAGTLPQITQYTPPTTQPAIVVAYQVHGDADRFAEVVRRNAVEYPNFVPPSPIEVKRDPPDV